jgi:molecular chaperone GrpE
MSDPRQEQDEVSQSDVPIEEAGFAPADPTLALRDEIATLEARLRTVSAAYQQKVDEIHAVRDRLERQARVQEEVRRGEVVASFFEPVENLHRSMEAAKGHPVESGLRMVYQQFHEALRRLGLEEVPGVGARFDADVHEALATVPVPDPAQDGVVTVVYAAGYRIGARLIRPARVVIGSYQAPADA